MAGFHRNIFSYYRGAAQREQDREQQLEDNTTKALVNTLECTDPEVATKFLEWLGVSAPNPFYFELQKPSIGEERIGRTPDRLLLAIVGTDDEANHSVCKQLPTPPVGDSRPDAWLYGDSFVVLLETKTGNSTLGLNQMACHWHKLQPTRWKIVTWAEVHRFFVALSPCIHDAKSRWLVEQFTQYLEWTGMTEFVGFKEEMFEFFVTPERDPDAKRWVRGAMDGLADKVLLGKQGLRHFNEYYADKHVGNLGKESDHYWAAFGPADFRKMAHQTIALYEQELDVFVNVELLPVVKKLRRKIKHGAGFREVMCKVPAPFTVLIEERKTTNQPRVFDYYPIAEVETGIQGNDRYGLKDVHSSAFDFIEKLLLEIEYPYLSIRRSISRRRVLELSKPNGDALVAEVLSILKGFHPLVEFINSDGP